MTKLFADIEGQERTVEYLSQILDAGNVTHAYLLCGSAGSGKLDMATRFAAGIISGGDEAEADAVIRGAHPDLHSVAPDGAAGYTKEQISGLVHDAALAPVRSQRKVYLIDHAETLNRASANAFLKTLEEPPEDVVCILLAPSEEAVLTTLRSRCQVLHMAQRPRKTLRDSASIDILVHVAEGADDLYVLESAKRLSSFSSLGTDELHSKHDAEVERSSDFLTKGALSALEKRQKREVTQHERFVLQSCIDAMRSWLRDCLLVADGMPEQVECRERLDDAEALAKRVPLKGIIDAIAACEKARSRITYNVTPQLAMEAMLLEIREALCPQS